jgi:hypothetical protein
MYRGSKYFERPTLFVDSGRAAHPDAFNDSETRPRIFLAAYSASQLWVPLAAGTSKGSSNSELLSFECGCSTSRRLRLLLSTPNTFLSDEEGSTLLITTWEQPRREIGQ